MKNIKTLEELAAQIEAENELFNALSPELTKEIKQTTWKKK